MRVVGLLAVDLLLLVACSGASGQPGPAPAPPRPGSVYWKGAGCLANTGCSVAPSAPPRCEQLGSTRSVGEILASGTTLLTERVRIRGRLRVSDSACTAGYCPNECCNECWAWLVVGYDARLGGKSVLLKGTDCHGDDSAACCRTRASGEEVIVEGILLRGGPVLQRGKVLGDPREPRVPYALESPTICAISAKGAP